jgi:hypothetical protein
MLIAVFKFYFYDTFHTPARVHTTIYSVQVLTAVTMMGTPTVLWDVTPCSLLTWTEGGIKERLNGVISQKIDDRHFVFHSTRT